MEEDDQLVLQHLLLHQENLIKSYTHQVTNCNGSSQKLSNYLANFSELNKKFCELAETSNFETGTNYYFIVISSITVLSKLIYEVSNKVGASGLNRGGQRVDNPQYSTTSRLQQESGFLEDWSCESHCEELNGSQYSHPQETIPGNSHAQKSSITCPNYQRKRRSKLKTSLTVGFCTSIIALLLLYTFLNLYPRCETNCCTYSLYASSPASMHYYPNVPY